jgi:NAD(P)-dependent dehydrogenase (short-subunit alcohol dehydrogenase family)
MKVRNKVLVVTGGGNGIGQQVVLEALRRGAKVAAVDIRQEGLDTTAALADAGDRLATYRVDITDRGAVEGLVGQVEATFGAVDGTINVAGIMQPMVRIKDLDYETMGRLVNINLWGTIHIVKSFLPTLLERPEAHITNVSSMGGYLPVPGQSIYGATKAAVKLMTEGLYAELLDTNVGVSVVFPGSIDTDIATNSGVDIGMTEEEIAEAKATRRLTSPEEAATIILDGIESNELHVYVGRDAKMMSLANRAAPKRAIHLIFNQMKEFLER